jgi:hypothetical protein
MANKECGMPFYFSYFENKLETNGTGWLVGNKLTIADLRLMCLTSWLSATICKQIALTCLSPSPDLFFSGPSCTAGWLALTPVTMTGVQKLQTANQIKLGQSGAAKGWNGWESKKTVRIRG